MTTTHPEASRNDVRTPATVAEAEDAWLVAITKGDEEQRQLMLPDCVIVHGPVGNIHERERFLGYNASMGATVDAETSEVTCRERGGRAIVTCFQKMLIRRLPDPAAVPGPGRGHPGVVLDRRGMAPRSHAAVPAATVGVTRMTRRFPRPVRGHEVRIGMPGRQPRLLDSPSPLATSEGTAACSLIEPAATTTERAATTLPWPSTMRVATDSAPSLSSSLTTTVPVERQDASWPRSSAGATIVLGVKRRSLPASTSSMNAGLLWLSSTLPTPEQCRGSWPPICDVRPTAFTADKRSMITAWSPWRTANCTCWRRAVYRSSTNGCAALRSVSARGARVPRRHSGRPIAKRLSLVRSSAPASTSSSVRRLAVACGMPVRRTRSARVSSVLLGSKANSRSQSRELTVRPGSFARGMGLSFILRGAGDSTSNVRWMDDAVLSARTLPNSCRQPVTTSPEVNGSERA